MENLNYEGIDLIGEDQLEESAENPVNTQLAKPAEQLSETPPESPEEPREVGEVPVSQQDATHPLKVNRTEGILDTLFDALAAPGQGLNDYVIDELNKIPGLNLRKAPRSESEAINAVRDIGGVIMPFMALRKAAGRGVVQPIKAKLPPRAQRSKALKLLGEAGLDMGIGGYVDATVEQNKYNDNLEATLKNNWPKFWSFIPADWATLSTDSPDVKHKKNIMSGMRMGVLTSSLEGLIRFHNALRNTSSFTKYFFKNKAAAKNLQQPVEEVDDVVDVVADSLAKREEALDEVGQLNLFNQQDMTNPVLGVDDVFNAGQSAMRDVDDMGVFAASVDNWRIMNNDGTVHGRLANMTSEAALEYGTDIAQMSQRSLVRGIAKQLEMAGDFDVVTPSGKNLSSTDQIAKAGDKLAEVIIDPLAEPGFVRALFDQISEVAPKVKDRAAKKALQFYKDEVANLDVQRASAYLSTSLAGQVSDFAEAMKHMDDPEAIARAQHQIFNRMEFLMSEVNASRKLNRQANAYVKGVAAGTIRPDMAEEAVDSAMEIMSKSAQDAKETVGQLRAIAKENPLYLKPMIEAMELADGNVQSLQDLFNYFQQSTSAIHKGLIDGQPEIRNEIVEGVYGMLRNAMLGAPSTFFKVFVGNKAMMLADVGTHFAGAAMRMDFADLKRGWYAYNSILDSFFKGSRYAAKIMYKASRNEDIIKPQMRNDTVNRSAQKLKVMKSFAEAAFAEGNEGPMYLYNVAQNMQDINDHVLSRYGPNAIAADDGFTKGVMHNIRSRFEAYDEAMTKGLPIDEAVDARAQEIFKSYYDEGGLLSNPAAEYIANDIGMDLDSPQTKAIGNFIKAYPFLRPFMFFSTAKGNAIRQFVEYSPVNAFMKDYDKLILNTPMRELTDQEIDAIMTPRGLPATRAEYDALKSKYIGKVAVGTMAMSLTLGMFLQGRIRGNGHFQANRQKVRRATNWQPKTYMGLDGKWYSYEWLGPIGDWVALMSDVMDAGSSITQNDAANLTRKAVFIFASAMADRQMYAGIEPLMDMMAGDISGGQRWAANMTSNLAPLGGLRRDMARLMNPALREVNDDFLSLLRNNNNWLDMFDKEGALPETYDWLTGHPVGVAEDWKVRAWNALSPMKVYEGHAKIPERQYLQDIEYDAVPIFNKGENGVDLTPDERSELYRIMGEQGTFRKAIAKIMNEYPADDFRTSLREARSLAPAGESIPADKWNFVYNRLDMAARAAREEAFNLMNEEMKADLKAREYAAGVNARRVARGEVPSALNMTNK